ncbi:MAG: TRAP transporter large permease [Xanthobacteraceae bacterium]|jgi:tripartite ATP-independent transporter DctM subunit|uniref:TRAP transporter large permease n=1 Tax=Pseudolabrys sp. TaxID=1960880 RepID=UPI003D095A8F
MSNVSIGLVGLAGLFALFAVRVPVGMSMLITGVAGTLAIHGWKPAMSSLTSETFAISNFSQLIVLPMFVLMGNLAGATGMGRDLYSAAYTWIGQVRGGLASATIVASACFAAMSGSSAASAVTMGRVALPEMRRFRYDDSLATGTVAAGGTLGFLIPPSAGFIIYAILTDQSIGRLFLAGVIPGLILTALFVIAITIMTYIYKDIGPAGPKTTFAAKIAATRKSLGIVCVVLLVIGGMYFGIFTPVEASGIGAFLTFVVAALRRRLTLPIINLVVIQTIRTCGTIFLILIGAYVFIPFMALSQVPSMIVGYLLSFDLGPTGLLLIIIGTYIVLGCFMEGFSMMVLTLPIVLPLLAHMQVDLIWFGVVAIIVIEMGLISPPVGLNVFIVKGIATDVPMSTIFRGIWPFWIAMAACIAILMVFPELALYLPRRMFH